MRATPSKTKTEHDTFYRKNGYLIADEVIPRADIEVLRKEALAVFQGKGGVRGVIPGSPEESETETLKRYLCMHYPHKISEHLCDFTRHPAIVEILQSIIGPNVKCMQTMLFVKGPGNRGQGWHQDEHFIATRDRSLCGVWVAMDDADQENGGLWVMPGSHKPGVLWPMAPNQDSRISGPTQSAIGFPYTEAEAVPVEVKAGSVVFFNGYLLHRSLDNCSTDRFRRALVIHVMSAESLLPWNCGGRFELKDDMRDIVMVCGEDPYADKGTEQLLHPFLRGESPDDYSKSHATTTEQTS